MAISHRLATQDLWVCMRLASPQPSSRYGLVRESRSEISAHEHSLALLVTSCAFLSPAHVQLCSLLHIVQKGLSLSVWMQVPFWICGVLNLRCTICRVPSLPLLMGSPPRISPHALPCSMVRALCAMPHRISFLPFLCAPAFPRDPLYRELQQDEAALCTVRRKQRTSSPLKKGGQNASVPWAFRRILIHVCSMQVA